MFDWNRFLALAERLAALADDEAAQRTAISRAYYAAYHATSAYARSRGILGGTHSHRRVWDAFAGTADADRANVGAIGGILSRRRQAADYRSPFPGDLAGSVRDAIIEARAVIEALERLR